MEEKRHQRVRRNSRQNHRRYHRHMRQYVVGSQRLAALRRYRKTGGMRTGMRSINRGFAEC